MSDNKPRVGVIGLGIMGSAMARNAARAGFNVTVANRSTPPLERAAQEGLRVAKSPAELAAACDIIAVMVTDPAAVRAVLSGPNGVFSADVKGKTLVQMSTIDEPSTLSFAAQAEDREMTFLDCPVAGSKKQVEEAQLILLAGGSPAVLERCRGFLLSVGKSIVHAGDVGKGTALKLCMNLIVAQMTTALCESVALAKAQGVDPARIFEVIGHSPAINCGYFKIKEKALLNSDFSPAFSLENMLKDVRFMTEVARETGDLPVTEAVRAVMESAAAEGLGKDDLTGLVRVLGRTARARG